MKIVLTTETGLAAIVLKNQIIAAVNGEIKGMEVETWAYTKSGDGFDIIYHNPQQYIANPERNVLFRVEAEGSEVVFTTAWWKSKPEPSREMLCLHTGRLTEMLLRYFRGAFVKFNVLDF